MTNTNWKSIVVLDEIGVEGLTLSEALMKYADDQHDITDSGYCVCAICQTLVPMATALEAQVNDTQSHITDLHAMAESNTATIDRLLAEVKALRELADTQAAIIAAKNAEIAEMQDDYAGALVNDDEAGMMLAASQGAQ